MLIRQQNALKEGACPCSNNHKPSKCPKIHWGYRQGACSCSTAWLQHVNWLMRIFALFYMHGFPLLGCRIQKIERYLTVVNCGRSLAPKGLWSMAGRMPHVGGRGAPLVSRCSVMPPFSECLLVLCGHF